MTDSSREPVGKRFVAAARRLNRNPQLVAWRGGRGERAMGDDEFVDLLSTAAAAPPTSPPSSWSSGAPSRASWAS